MWRGFGFWVLYFLAGVQGVPGDLLDAARVDGASGARRFFRVTVPVLYYLTHRARPEAADAMAPTAAGALP